MTSFVFCFFFYFRAHLTSDKHLGLASRPRHDTESYHDDVI